MNQQDLKEIEKGINFYTPCTTSESTFEDYAKELLEEVKRLRNSLEWIKLNTHEWGVLNKAKEALGEEY